MSDKNKLPSSDNYEQFRNFLSENPVMKRRMDKYITEWEKRRNQVNTK